MDAGVQQFTKFISDDIMLVVPVYQRTYAWKTANCQRLFDDIKKDKPHFIGTFVYKKKSSDDIFQDYIIIDGQQRIASIILFARALYEFADDALKRQINAKFLRHTFSGEMQNVYRLRPTEFDCGVFKKIIDGTDDFTADEKSSVMYKNYDLFRKQIAASQIEPQKFFNAIYKLKVVAIRLDDENAQEIFESLNSTGLDLSQADLIRNFLLMDLDVNIQEKLYKNYWLQIEELLRSSDRVENFIIQYLITKRKSDHITENDKSIHVTRAVLYRYFKRYFDEKYPAGNREDFLKDLYRYAKFFHRLIFNDDTKFENLSALDKKFYELTFLLKADNAPIVLMYLLDRHEKKLLDEATFIQFVDVLISFTFRTKVCRVSGITAQFAGNLLAHLDGYKENFLDTDAFWQSVMSSKKSAFPKDDKFQDELATKSLYKMKDNLCKYLLYSLERAARAKELPSYSQATVEHIMPQKLNDTWEKYLEKHDDLQNHDKWLHTLGNLTLTGENSELGNKAFDAKKEIYSHSNFYYTRTLTGYSYWTTRQIQSRAKKLAEAATKKVWTLPEEFNAKIQSTANLFYLDSDFKSLKGEKPEIFSFLGTEIKIGDWIKMLREVVRQLYALDADTFRRATQLENVRRNLFTTEPNDYKIDENFYMRGGFDTEFCLKTIKALVENFDSIGGTNLKDEIYFTIKH